MKEKIITFCAFLILASSWCLSQTCNPPTATLKVGYSQTADPNTCNPAGTALCKPAGETYPNAFENQVWSAKIQIPSYCPHPDDPPNSLAAAEFRVNFDKLKLQATDETGAPITQLTAGTAFPNIILNEVNNTDGFIRYAAYALSGQSSPSEVVAFYFKAIASAAETTISYVGANCEIAIVADYPGRSIIPPQLTLTNLTVKINDTTPPAIPTWSEPPTNAGDGQIVLSWAPNTDPDMNRYRVYFKSTTIDVTDPPAKTEFSAQAYVNHPTVTYTHTGLTNDTVKYWYIITALDLSGNGDDKVNRSSSIKWDIPTGIKPPATPTGLTTSATYTAGNKKISVTWNKVITRSDGSTLPIGELAGYNVYRASAQLGGTCGSYTRLGSAPTVPKVDPQPTTYTYTDTSIFNQTKYCYKVDAQDTGGRKSNPAAGPQNVDFNDPPPPIPTGLAGVAGDRKVDISWNAVTADDLAGYNLYRAALAGTTAPPDVDFTLVNTSAPIVETTYSNISLTNGTTYWYKITAVDTAPGTPSESARSTAIRVKIPEETPPVLQSATPKSLTRVDLLFNEKLQTSSANNKDNYTISGLTISAAALQVDGKTVRLTTSSQTANQPYTVEVRNVKDQYLNEICGPVPPHPTHNCPNTANFTGFSTDTIPPVVSSAGPTEPPTPTTVIVNFLDQTGLESGSAQTTSNYTICPVLDETSTTCLTPNLSISAASCTGDCLQVTLTTSSQLNRWYRVKVINVTDSAPAQNMILDNNSTNVANFEGTCTETTPPGIGSPSNSVVSAITIDVNFNEIVDSTTANNKNNYTFSPPLNVTTAARQASPNQHRVRLTTATQACGTNYTLTIQGVKDTCLNEIISPPGIQVSNIIGYDSCPPTVVSATAGDTAPETDDNTRARVNFSEAVQSASANTTSNYSIKIKGTTTPLSVTAAALQSGNTTVVLTTASQFKGREYTTTVINVKDTIGNTIVNNGTTNVADFIGVCGIDCISPTLSSAQAISGTIVELTFDENVDATTANNKDNYSISPSLSITAAARQSDNKKVRLTTATQSNIDYTVTVIGVTDLRGNRLDSPGQQATFRGWDSILPTVSLATSTANTKVVVTFSEAVDVTTSQTASNYTLTPTLAVSSAVRLSAPDTNKVELTTAGQLNQTYQVRVRNVKDLNNNTIADNGTTNVANFSGTCTESTPPQLASATPATSTTINLLFNENLDAASANITGNYSLSPSLSISAAALQADNRTVRLTTVAQTCGTNYTVTATNVKDLCLNAVQSPNNTANFTGYDSCPPKVSSAQGIGPTSCEVVFDEKVTSVTANVASNYSIKIGTTTPLSVTAAALQSDEKTVRLTTATQAINTTYTVTVSNVKDLNNNTVAAPNNTADFLSKIVDTEPPNITSLTIVNATTLDVLFDEDLNAASANTAGNYTILPALVVSSAQLQADNRTVRLTTATQSCGTNYTIEVRNVMDLYSNAILAGNPRTAPFTGFDSCPPTVASATSTSNTKVIVTFSEAVDLTTSQTASNYTMTPTLSVSLATRLAETNKVELTTAGQLNQTYQVRVRNVKDTATVQNTIVDSGTIGGNVAEFAGTPIETVPPQVSSATPTSGTIVNVLFNEDMDSASCNIKENYSISPSISITAAALQTDKRTVRLTITTAPENCGTNFTVTVTNVKDANLNTIGSTNNTANFTGWDSCSPTVVGASVPSNVKVIVAFSEQVSSGATTTSNYTMSIIEGGCAALTVSSAVLLTGNTTVELTTSVQGPCKYRVRVRNVKDLNNNTIVDNQTTNTVDFMGECDDSAFPGSPNLVPINAVRAINATTVDAEFNEELNSTTANNKNNYTLTSSLSITTAALQTDKKTVRLTTATQQGIEYTLSVLGVADKCLNAITTAQTRNFTGFDSTPPTVVTPAVTQDGQSTKVTVVFSEPVDLATSQTTGNYTFTPILSVSSAVRQVETNKVSLTTSSQSSVEYTVRVVNVKDINLNTIVNNGTTNIAKFQGAVPPKISSATPISSTTLDVLFDKLLDSVTANNDGNYTIEGLTISGALLQDNNKVCLTTSPQTCGSSYTVSVINVKDAYGNTITTPETKGFTGFDNCPPTIVQLTVVSSTRVDILFSENMQASSANTAGNYVFSPSLSVPTAPALQSDQKTVRLTTAAQGCGTSYILTISNVRDLASNVITSPNNTEDFVGYDSCPPTISPQATVPEGSSTEVIVTISEPVQSATIIAGNFTITISGTTTPLAINDAILQSNVPGNVKVKLITDSQGPNEYKIRVRNVKDTAGNTISDNGTTNVATFAGYCLDTVPGTPTISSNQVISGTTIDIVFNEDLDSVSATTSSNYVFLPTLSVQQAVLQSDQKKVRLTTATQTCHANYTISVTGVKDKCFNAIPQGTPQTTNFVGADTCGPILLSAETTLGVSDKVNLTFNEAVDLTTSQVAGNYSITPTLSVLSAQRDTDTTKVILTTVSQSNQQYTVRVINVRDVLQNVILNNTTNNTKTFSGEPPEKVPPSISTISAPMKTVANVEFSEEVEATSANAVSNYTISGLIVSSAQLQPDNRTVKLSTSRQNTGQNYLVEVRNVKDKYLNAIPADVPATGNFSGSSFEDVTPPQILSAVSKSKTTVEVNFDEEVETTSAQTAGNYTISGLTVSLPITKQLATRVLLTTSTQTDGATLTVKAKNIKDTMVPANVCSTDGCNGQASFIVPDYTPPRVSSASSQYLAPDSLVKVVFNEPVDGVTAQLSTNYSITSPTLTVLSATLDGSDTTDKTVLLRTSTQSQALLYTPGVTVTGVKDKFNNTITTNNTAQLTGCDSTRPTYVAISLSQTQVQVAFSEGVITASATNIANYKIENPSLTITVATIDASQTTVTLTTSLQSRINYILDVFNVLDLSGLLVATTGNTKTFLGKVNDPVTGAPYIDLATAKYIQDNYYLDILFNEDLDGNSVGNVANWTINNQLTVTSAELLSDKKTVRLTTGLQVEKLSYTLTVNNVEDIAGNKIASNSQVNFIGVDITSPKLLSAVAVNSTTIDLIFDENVSSTTADVAGNYIIPGLTVSSAARQADLKKVRLTTSSQVCSPPTEYTLTVNNVTDTSNNVIDIDNKIKTFTGFDSCVPQVVSAQTISKTTVKVTFDETVELSSAQTLSNYSITPAITVTASQRQSDTKIVILTTTSQADNTTYTVSVKGVKDVIGNNCSLAGCNGSAQFTTGDYTPPTVVSAQGLYTNDIFYIKVVFNEGLDPASVTATSNYAITGGIIVQESYLDPGDILEKTVTLKTSSQIQGTSYTVTVINVKDKALNTISGSNTANFTGPDTPPYLVLVSSLSQNTVRVEFSEEVGSGSNTVSNYAITPSLNISAAALQSGNKIVHLTTSSQQLQNYTLVVNNVRDLTNNPISAENSKTFFGKVDAITVGDTCIVSAISKFIDSNYYVDVEFSLTMNPDTTCNRDNYSITDGITVSNVQLLEDNKIARLLIDSPREKQLYTLTVNNVTDSTNKLLSSTGKTKEFTGVDIASPKLLSTTSINSTTVELTFDENVDATTANTVDNYSISPSLSISVAARQTDNKKVLLTTSSQVCNPPTEYTVTINNVQDTSNNAIDPSANSGVFSGWDSCPPTVLSAVSLSATTVEVTFSEPIDEATSQTAGNYTITPSLAVSSPVRQQETNKVILTTTGQKKENYSVRVQNVKDLNNNVIVNDGVGNLKTFLGTPSETVPPKVISTWSISSAEIEVVFDEDMNSASVSSSANYVITPPGVTVSSATLRPDKRTVAVQVQVPGQVCDANYTVTVINVMDVNLNAIANVNNTANFVGWDSCPPTVVSSAISKSPTEIEIVFSEKVDLTTSQTNNYYQITPFYQFTPSLSIVSVARAASDEKSVLITTSEQLNQNYTVRVRFVKDLRGNTILDNGTTNVAIFAGTPIDTTPLYLESATASSTNSIDITFNKSLNSTTAETSNNYTIFLNDISIPISSAVLQPGGKTVKLTTGAQTCSITYALRIDGVKDIYLNPISPKNCAWENVDGWDSCKPELTGTVSDSFETVKVYFSEDINKTTAETIANYGITGLNVSLAVQQEDKTIIVLTTSPQIATTYTLTVNNVQDLNNNTIPSNRQRTFTGISVNTEQPQVISAMVINVTTVDVKFHKDMESASATVAGNYTISPSLSIAGVQLSDNRTVRLTTAPQTCSEIYKVTVLPNVLPYVKDIYKNLVDPSLNEADFIGLDSCPPTLLSARTNASEHSTVYLEFSEAVDLTSSQNVGNYTISGLTVQSATRLAEPNKVRLITSFHKIQTYQVRVRNVKDTAPVPNTIADNSTTNVANFSGEPPEFEPPQVLSAIAPTNATVEVRFRNVMDLQGNMVAEKLDEVSAKNIANYIITPSLQIIPPVSFSRDRVILTTSSQTPLAEYTVKVVQVADEYLNYIVDDGITNVGRFIGKCTDITPPALVTLNPVSVLYNKDAEQFEVKVVFNENLSPATVRNLNNYRITYAGDNVLPHSAPRLLADKKTISLTTDVQTQGVDYTLTISNIADECQNVITSPTSTIFKGADAVPPRITQVNVIDYQTLEIVFSENVNVTSASPIYNYTIYFADRPGELGVDPTKAVNVSGNIVRLPTREQQKEWYILEVYNVRDESGNEIYMEWDEVRQIEANKWKFEGKSKDTTAPYVAKDVLYQKHPTRTDLGQVVVEFSEAMHSDTALTSNYEITPARTIYLTRGYISPDGTKITLDVEKFIDGVSYVVKVKKTDKVKDVAGNMIENEYISGPIVVDDTPPQLSSARAISNTQVELTFSEEIGQPGSYTITPTLTIDLTKTKVEGNKVILTTSSHTGGVNYTVVASGATDKSGNPISTNNTASFVGRLQSEYPILETALSESSTSVLVKFDAPTNKITAELTANYTITPSLSISSCVLLSDKMSVRITTSAQQDTYYYITIEDIKLEVGEIPSPQQQKTFRGTGIITSDAPRAQINIESQTKIKIIYDKEMGISAGTLANYTIYGLSISSVALQNDSKTVEITTSTQRAIQYTLSISPDVKDKTEKVIDAGSRNIPFIGKDETNPTLSHSPVNIAPMGKEISITATANDNTQVSRVELYYKRKNEVSFRKEIMALVTGTTNQYRKAIPASEVTLYDIEYYLVAYDVSGNTLKTNTYTIKGGVDKIEITRSDKNVSSITVQVGDIIYLKAKCYLGDNPVIFAGISFEEGEGFAWTDKQKKGSIMPISSQEIKYFPEEKGDEVIEVVLTVAQKEIKATLNIAIDKGIEDIVSIDPEEYNIGNLAATGCTGCQRPLEPIVFPPMKITAIKEDGNKDATKKPITNNVVFYFNHRTSSAKERGIVNREVRIYDMQGRLVKKLEVRSQDGATFLNTNDLPRGLYIYQGVEIDGSSGAVIQSEKPKMIRILR